MAEAQAEREKQNEEVRIGREHAEVIGEAPGQRRTLDQLPLHLGGFGGGGCRLAPVEFTYVNQ